MIPLLRFQVVPEFDAGWQRIEPVGLRAASFEPAVFDQSFADQPHKAMLDTRAIHPAYFVGGVLAVDTRIGDDRVEQQHVPRREAALVHLPQSHEEFDNRRMCFWMRHTVTFAGCARLPFPDFEATRAIAQRS